MAPYASVYCVSALQAHWERVLESEGLGANVKRTPKQALAHVNTDIPCAEYADSPVLARWTRLTHEVHALPAWFPHRAVLVTFCETGYAARTAKIHKIGRSTVYRALRAFEAYVKHGR